MKFFNNLFSNLNNSSQSITNPAKFYIIFDGEKIQIPVPPSEFKVTVNQNNETLNINNLGELKMLGKTGLLNISLSSFFPNQQYSFCQCQVDKPYSYISKIEKCRNSEKPCRLLVTETPINYSVVIDAFIWGENDGSGDVYFTIEFSEYRFVGSNKDATINIATGLKERNDISNNQKNNRVVVYPSDSLMDVSSRILKKDGSDYLGLYKKLVKNTTKIVAGETLKLNDNSIKIGDTNVLL